MEKVRVNREFLGEKVDEIWRRVGLRMLKNLFLMESNGCNMIVSSMGQVRTRVKIRVKLNVSWNPNPKYLISSF